MDRRAANQLAPPTAAARRALTTIALLLLSTALLTLAYAPAGQFYLAWIGLAPWLWVVHRARSTTTAFWWSWLGGIFFFMANLWWIERVNVVGLFALTIYCGVYFALIAFIVRGARLLDRPAPLACLGVAAVWTAGEYIRGRLMTGLPWLFIGHTQTPLLPACQIADTLGVYGVSFWVVTINVLATLLLMRRPPRSLIPAAAMVALLSAASIGYGLWRMGQTADIPGPTVLVVQSNYPQSNAGEKPVSDDDLLRFHVDATRMALQKAKPVKINLAVWSETMLPPLNRESLVELTQTWPCDLGRTIQKTLSELSLLTADQQIGILTGGRYCAGWQITQTDDGPLPHPADSRNTAYLFQPDGTFSDLPGRRYDKIHLVPFGEFIPFHYSIPILYKLFLALGPKYYAEYELHDGTDNGLTVFQLQNPGSAGPGAHTWRFVTPICFEDIDAGLVSRMFRPGPDGRKRADFIVNITNDGWFAAAESAQHFQAATFRSIENRVPTARSVNTGVSGFIDSNGRTAKLIGAGLAGTSWAQLMLDSRVSLYTRFGDWFAWACVIFTAGELAWLLIGPQRRRAGKREDDRVHKGVSA